MDAESEEDYTVIQLRFLKCGFSDSRMLKSSRTVQMLSNLGLEEFIQAPIPDLDADLCTEFVRSFTRMPQGDGGIGIVRGRSIKICAHTVRSVTALPLGDRGYKLNVSDSKNCTLLGQLAPSMKRKDDGYYLPRLSRRLIEHLDEFLVIARALMEKLMCKADGDPDFADGSVLLGMYISLRDHVVFPWAGFMARIMIDAIVPSKERGMGFPFGEWLSGIIRSQLRARAAESAVQTGLAPKDAAPVSYELEAGEAMDISEDHELEDARHPTAVEDQNRQLENIAEMKKELEREQRELEDMKMRVAEMEKLKKELEELEGICVEKRRECRDLMDLLGILEELRNNKNGKLMERDVIVKYRDEYVALKREINRLSS